ncbi:MAG: hypothetical protein M1819_002488 [Sarea resinae]|nr:MAG: hypothetical protein M1819_002488 [Sarea resinae]
MNPSTNLLETYVDRPLPEAPDVVKADYDANFAWEITNTLYRDRGVTITQRAFNRALVQVAGLLMLSLGLLLEITSTHVDDPPDANGNYWWHFARNQATGRLDWLTSNGAVINFWDQLPYRSPFFWSSLVCRRDLARMRHHERRYGTSPTVAMLQKFIGVWNLLRISVNYHRENGFMATEECVREIADLQRRLEDLRNGLGAIR